MYEIDLCETMITEMRKLEFSDRSIEAVRNSQQFQQALGKPDTYQRTYLTMLINKIFTMGPWVVPAEIRLSLNIATDCYGWSDDLKLVLLPFLKVNEESFFA